jgi:hypothetical protein
MKCKQKHLQRSKKQSLSDLVCYHLCLVEKINISQQACEDAAGAVEEDVSFISNGG